MEDTRDSLELQNAFYKTIREELEADSFGKWGSCPTKGWSVSMNPTARHPKSRSS